MSEPPQQPDLEACSGNGSTCACSACDLAMDRCRLAPSASPSTHPPNARRTPSIQQRLRRAARGRRPRHRHRRAFTAEHPLINRLSRLVKTPKLHLGDTGLACALLGLDTAALAHDRMALGPLLQTFVFQELRRQAAAHGEAHEFFHFRDKDGGEVDIVVERGTRQLAGVEVKASATVTDADFRGLRRLQAAAGRRFAAGIVLYDGEASGASFGDGLYAVSLRALWEAA